jgi:phage tail protein X
MVRTLEEVKERFNAIADNGDVRNIGYLIENRSILSEKMLDMIARHNGLRTTDDIDLAVVIATPTIRDTGPIVQSGFVVDYYDEESTTAQGQILFAESTRES